MGDKTPDSYFILIYRLPEREVEIEPFESDFERAADTYAMLEERHREDDRVEVVLVGADSIETIKRTHSHYFAHDPGDLFKDFLQELEQSGTITR
jgi:hypothetical protein